ncbi:VanZ family protein [Patiriisocius marinus]|uniref:VanZ family protein n=1 Tax=Patiriisocius marinus TaxID=1397112 RepID=UPI00232D569C|nr:VanZ family protein [Patiriisocius marinus]
MMQLTKNLLAPKNILLAAISFSIIITIALLSPTGDVTETSIKNVDKVVHFGIHMLLVGFWLYYFYRRNLNEISNGLVAKVLIFIFLYGIIIEFLQTYLDFGRTGDVFDVIANTAGLIAGFIAFRIFQKRIL